MQSMKRLWLPIEFILLCIALPTFIIVFRQAPNMFGYLWGAYAFCYLIMRYHFGITLKDLWKWDAVTWENMKPILIRWALACIGMTAFIYFYDPERMFRLLLERPGFIPFLLILYPLLSAFPQEFIFCSFFFERYKRFFPTQTAMIHRKCPCIRLCARPVHQLGRADLERHRRPYLRSDIR